MMYSLKQQVLLAGRTYSFNPILQRLFLASKTTHREKEMGGGGGVRPLPKRFFFLLKSSEVVK